MNLENNIMNLTDLIEERNGWWWPKADTDGWNYMNTHSDTPQKLSTHVKNKNVIVQAGGHCGFYIREYAKIFNTVYTFEPDPLNFICLTVNVDSPNVVKFQSCVGNAPKYYSLTSYSRDSSASFISGHGILPTIKIDDLELESCDLIQLDTEGFEYFGLLGAAKTIEKFKPVISVEWWEEWGARYGIKLQMIEEFLSKWNYKYVAQYATDRVYTTE